MGTVHIESHMYPVFSTRIKTALILTITAILLVGSYSAVVTAGRTLLNVNESVNSKLIGTIEEGSLSNSVYDATDKIFSEPGILSLPAISPLETSTENENSGIENNIQSSIHSNSQTDINVSISSSSDTASGQPADSTITLNGVVLPVDQNGRTQRFELEDGSKVRVRVDNDGDSSSTSSVVFSVDGDSSQEGGAN